MNRRTAVAVAVPAVLVSSMVLVWTLRPAAGSGPAAPSPTIVEEIAAPAVVADPDAAVSVAGVPVGWARTVDGAAEAAVAWTLAHQVWFYADSDDVYASIRAVTAASFEETFLYEMVERLMDLRSALASKPASGLTWFSMTPLAVRAVDVDEDGGTVEVWVVTVFSRERISDPSATWETFVFDVVWEDGDWRMADLSVRVGPIPGTDYDLPATMAAEFSDVMAGFVPAGSS